MVIDKSKLTKLYYTITEVADLFNVTNSLLRYWETEFESIDPKKSRTGIRRYTAGDIEKIEKIYDLLKVRGFTIEGAKKELKRKVVKKENTVSESLQSIKDRLIYLKNLLDQ